MKNLFCDLTTGWATTLRKHSTQLNIANIIWSGGALLALQFGYIPEWFMPYAFGVALVLLVLATLASNMTQKTVMTIDPTKVDVTPKDGTQ